MASIGVFFAGMVVGCFVLIWWNRRGARPNKERKWLVQHRRTLRLAVRAFDDVDAGLRSLASHYLLSGDLSTCHLISSLADGYRDYVAACREAAEPCPDDATASARINRLLTRNRECSTPEALQRFVNVMSLPKPTNVGIPVTPSQYGAMQKNIMKLTLALESLEREDNGQKARSDGAT